MLTLLTIINYVKKCKKNQRWNPSSVRQLVCAHTSSPAGFGSGLNICASWQAVGKLGG